MKIKVILLAALFALNLSVSKAQSLRIVYDFNKDEITYYKTKPGDKVGVEISQPIVGRNKMVKFEVTNFNKFVYAANCDFESSVSEETSSVNLFNTIMPLVFPGSSQTFFSSLGGAPPEVGRGGRGLLSSRSALMAYEDLQEAYASLSKLESSVNNLDYAIKKLNELKYNKYLPTDTIVKMSDHLVQMVLAQKTVNPSDFSDLVVLYNDRYSNSTQQLSNASNSFLSAYNEFAVKHDSESFEGRGLNEYAKGLQTQLNAFTSETSAQDVTDKINTLENLYTSIKTTSFVFNASQMAEDDQILIKIGFYENPVEQQADLSNLDALKKVKEKTIRVTVKGDMKINSSIGLGFPYFGTNENYINKDSIITSQEGNNYSPNLAAYINFYPYSGRIANLGGTFGVGVPLTDKNRNLNIFMGLSGLFGSENRIAIHGGMTLGQVKSLDQGHEVGDKLLSSTQEVPIRNTWQWGAFAGISFSLANLQQ